MRMSTHVFGMLGAIMGNERAPISAGTVDPLRLPIETERIRRIKGMMKKRLRRDAQQRRRDRRRMAKLSRRKNYQVLGRRG